jgi:hypothetical protein
MKQTFVIPEEQKTIPAMDVDYFTNEVVLKLDDKTALVNFDRINVTDPDKHISMGFQTKTVDLVQLLSDEGFSASEVTTIKTFVKAVVAKGWDKVTADITEEPF